MWCLCNLCTFLFWGCYLITPGAKTDKSKPFVQMCLHLSVCTVCCICQSIAWTKESAAGDTLLVSLCSLQEALIFQMLTRNRMNIPCVAQGVNDTNKDTN